MSTNPSSITRTGQPASFPRTDRATGPVIRGERKPPDRVDAGGTRLRLRSLHVMGHGSARIARALDARKTTIQELVNGTARTVSPQLRDAVIDLYDTWWDKRAPERTRAERAARAADLRDLWRTHRARG